MDDERWEALVRRLEPEARARPQAHRRKVLLLAALGYAFIGALLAILAALALVVVVAALKGHGVILLKLLIPIGALLWVVARSLYVRFEPPAGIPVERTDAPALLAMIDEVRDAIRGPRIRRVLVDGDANAGVVQVPRLGGIAGSRNYLLLGLPYLQGLSAEQFRAVVAHELGHLSRSHGRFGAFVYRVRATWVQLLEGFEHRDSIWTALVRRFFLWYVPYFNAYSLPVARAHEFEADDAAAAVTSREAAASSLVAGTLVARWLSESYWPGIYRRAVHEPAPPSVAFAPLASEIVQAKRGQDVEPWYRALLGVETDVTDSHPSIAERIAHLGVAPDEALRLAREDGGESAVAAYLGAAATSLAGRIDNAWRAEIASEWGAEHERAMHDRAELERLEREESLPPERALLRAQLTEKFRGSEPALARYRELVGSANDVPARFAVGRLLVERDDDEGLRWLDEAMDRDPDAVLPSCEVAYGYLFRRGRDEEAQAYLDRAKRQAALLEGAHEERSRVTVDDRLEPANVPADVRESLRKAISLHEEVAEAYLVRKRTEHFDDTHPFFVLAVLPRSAVRTARKEARDDVEPLESRVQRVLSFPHELVVVKVGSGSSLAKRFAEAAGAPVFERG